MLPKRLRRGEIGVEELFQERTGRLLAPRFDGSLRSYGLVFLGVVVTATLSYAVSNGAFYWLGGRYASPHMAEYLSRFMQWAPLFVRAAAMYVLAALVVHAFVARFVPREGGRGAAHV